MKKQPLHAPVPFSRPITLLARFLLRLQRGASVNSRQRVVLPVGRDCAGRPQSVFRIFFLSRSAPFASALWVIPSEHCVRFLGIFPTYCNPSRGMKEPSEKCKFQRITAALWPVLLMCQFLRFLLQNVPKCSTDEPIRTAQRHRIFPLHTVHTVRYDILLCDTGCAIIGAREYLRTGFIRSTKGGAKNCIKPKKVKENRVTISNCSKGLIIIGTDIRIWIYLIIILSGEEGLEPSTIGFENKSSTN